MLQHHEVKPVSTQQGSSRITSHQARPSYRTPLAQQLHTCILNYSARADDSDLAKL